MKKIRVGILFGGRSAEHEVSLQSAKNVIDAIDKNTYEVVPIGINREGKWLLGKSSQALLSSGSEEESGESRNKDEVALIPDTKNELLNLSSHQSAGTVDVIFPVLHGTYGEDGTMQGLLKLANIPFVGAGVLSSAVGMDKDVMKRLLKGAGIPISKFLVFHEGETIQFAQIEHELGLPFFVKPANAGSSIGVSKVHDHSEFTEALEKAFSFDRKIIIEEYINGREVECAVLGNDPPVASVAGEIIPKHEFYDYEAKYLDEKGALLKIPAEVSPEVLAKIQELAIQTFQVLCCEGMGRVDMFLTPDGKLYVNEINTIPGFTIISMYPKLWEASGVSYSELIDRLIQLALERFEKEEKLKTSRL